MFESNALISFKTSYLVSIIFGTMPVRIKLTTGRDQKMVLAARRTKIEKKFAAITIVWMALACAFFISDINIIYVLSPTLFFSKKVIDNFPNDYYSLRLLRNAEIWFLLVWGFVAGRRLPRIIDDLKSYRKTQPYLSLSKSRKKLYRKSHTLIIFYSTITILPVICDLFHLYQYELDHRRIIQEILYCIPITINLQFCSLCLLLSNEFDALNEAVRESCSLFPENVRDIGQSHSTICQLVCQLNRTYQLQLFSETGIVTLNILLHTFHVLNANNHKLPSPYADIMVSCLWTVHFTGRLFTTCMLASNTVTQAKETRKILLQFEDCNQISTNHEQIISLINRITNQDINFNICGFFTLDGNLIVSVCSWCISFILILLQFRTPT